MVGNLGLPALHGKEGKAMACEAPLRKRQILLAAFFLTLSACTSKYQIRGIQRPLACISLDEFVRSPLRQIDTQARSVEDYCTFKLGIVEFSEAGLRNDAQYEQVLTMVENATEQGGIIVTYVHGWHHGPHVCDSNLACFRRVLNRVASSQQTEGRPVVGIYVGWRGESITKPIINLATLWSRKLVAEDIGRKGGTQLLTRLHELWDDRNRKHHETTLVTVGHSLGGAFLLSALKGSMTGEIGRVAYPDGTRQPNLRVVSTEEARDPTSHDKARRSRFGDLVILVNPAIESNLWDPFDQDLLDVRRHAEADGPYTRRNPPEANLPYAADQMPALMVVASHADAAVRWLFPIGQWVAPWTNPHIFRHASASVGLGHFGAQATHSLTYEGNRSEFGATGCDCSDVGSTKPTIEGKIELRTAAVQRLGKLVFAVNQRRLDKRGWDLNSPYLVIQADKSVIDSHNDIFNPVFTEFLIRYIAAYAEVEHRLTPDGTVIPMERSSK
jgi:hypothetical protein